MGNTCKPMAVSFQCVTKFTTEKKKKEMGLSTRKRALTRSESSGTLVSDLPASRNVSSKYLLLAPSPPPSSAASGVLLWQPELRQKVQKKTERSTERSTTSTMVVNRLWFVQLELKPGCQMQFAFLWKRSLEIDSTAGNGDYFLYSLFY